MGFYSLFAKITAFSVEWDTHGNFAVLINDKYALGDHDAENCQACDGL
jgi:hypothetical protein